MPGDLPMATAGVLSISDVHVDADTLEFMGSVLDVVKERKGRGEEHVSSVDLWSDIAKKIPQFTSLLGGPEMKSAAEMVRKITLFVNAIAESLEESMPSPKCHTGDAQEIRSREIGLMSLPDEILSIIIELAALAHEPGYGALELSQVCRRFRANALHLRRIWTRVSSQWYGYKMACLYVERSNHAGLEVTVNDLEFTHSCVNLLRAVIPYCCEWRSFSYTGYNPANQPRAFYEHRIPMELPRLEHLQVECDVDDVYKLYDMPNLKSAEFIDAVPLPSSLTSITRFSMTVSTIDREQDVLHCPLFRFLSTVPSLKELALSFKFITSANINGVPSVLSLQNVETFSLNVLYSDDDAGDEKAVHRIVETLRMPNLSQMSLSVRFGSGTSRTLRKDSLVFDLLPFSGTHPRLKSLHLIIIDQHGKYDDDGSESSFHSHYHDYNDMLSLDVEDVPFLTSLTLTTNFKLHLSSKLEVDGPFIPLRRLELNHCPRLTNDFLADAYVGLNRDGNWDSFEEAIVKGCPKITTDAGFLNRLTEGKLRSVPVPQSETDPMGYDDLHLWS